MYMHVLELEDDEICPALNHCKDAVTPSLHSPLRIHSAAPKPKIIVDIVDTTVLSVYLMTESLRRVTFIKRKCKSI